MATSTRFPAPIIITLTQNHASTRRAGFVVMCSNKINHILQTSRSSHKKKVFEDGSAGIVCYRDENGEITCEGYDEGPRFHPTFNHNTSRTRDVEIIQLLQKCWLLQVSDETKGKGGGY